MKKISCLLIVAILAGIFSGCSILRNFSGNKNTKTTKIELEDYFDYELSGVDGDGFIEPKIDYKEIIDDNDELEKVSVIKLENAIRGSFDQDSGLKNSDVVTWRWDNNKTLKKLEEKYNVSFECDDIIISISGLVNKNAFNPFDYMEYTLEGTNKNGSVIINPADTVLGKIYFIPSDDAPLKNGDKLTIIATLEGGKDLEQECQKNGYELAATTMEIEINNLPDGPVNLNEYFEIVTKQNGKLPIDIMQVKNIDSATVDRINKEIFDFVTSPEGYDGDAEYYTYYSLIPVNKSIFTLLVIKEQATDYFDIVCYTIDTATGLQLSNKEIISLAGVNENEFNSYAKAAAQNAMNSIYKLVYNDGELSFVNGELNTKSGLAKRTNNGKDKQFRDVYNDKMFNINVPMFLDSNEKLCFMCDLYSCGGAERYPAIYDYNGRVLSYAFDSGDNYWDLSGESSILYRMTVKLDINCKPTKYKTIEYLHRDASYKIPVNIPSSKPVELYCKVATSSNYYTQKDGVAFVPALAVDGNKKTAWNDRKNNGVGEKLTLEYTPGTLLKEIYINPGYTKTKKIFDANYAPSLISISTKNQTVIVDLNDVCYNFDKASKGLHVAFDEWVYLPDGLVTITILDVRAGKKYKDCCISEVKFYGVEP